MLEPIDPIVADLLKRLSQNMQDEFQERSAIFEFEAHFPRRLAEALGLIEILRCNMTGLTGVSAIQIELDGQTQWLATTDLAYARQQLTEIHATEIAVLDLRTVIEEQYNGIAMLATIQ